jgi:plasmid maintenance system killer protein
MANTYIDPRSVAYDSLSPMQQQNCREQAAILVEALSRQDYHSSFVNLLIKRLHMVLETRLEEEKRALDAKKHYEKLKHNK